MSFRLQIWLLPITMAVIVSIGIAINARITSHASESLRQIEAVQFPALELLRRIRSEFATIQDSLRQAVMAGDHDEVEVAASHAATIREELAELRNLRGESELADRLGKAFDGYYRAAIAMTAVLMGDAEGDTGSMVGAMQNRLRSLDELLEQSADAALVDFEALLTSSGADVERTLLISMLSALITMLALGAGSWVLIRQVYSSLGGEPELASDIVRRIADGDFTTHVPVRPDDHSSLLAGIGGLKYRLGELVGDIYQASEAVGATAAEVRGAVGNLSERTSSQAASLEETATSMEEMTSTLRQSADHSRSATELATKARQQAEAGGLVVNRAVEAMSQIHASSDKIADIIGVIDEIAFQTNLLALNAAVEAARAGDQGRGFAVVASEVRNLAQRSSSAARQIKDLIEDSVRKVQDGQTLVNESGEHLTGIVGSVATVAELITDISAASHEQSAGLEQVNRAVMHMDEVTQHNSSMVDEVTSFAQTMSDQAERLNAIIEQFTVATEAQSNRLRLAAGDASTQPPDDAAWRDVA